MYGGGAGYASAARTLGFDENYTARGSKAIEDFMMMEGTKRMALDATSDMNLRKRYDTITGLDSFSAFTNQEQMAFIRKTGHFSDEEFADRVRGDITGAGLNQMFQEIMDSGVNYSKELFEVLPDALKDEEGLLREINAHLKENLERLRTIHLDVTGGTAENGVVEEGESTTITLGVST